MHLSDISWDMPGEEAVRNYQKGQQLEAMVLSIDPERERISLGIKQLAKDPFSAYIAENPKGTIVRGTVKEVDARGAIIDLGNGVEGQLRASELGRDRVEDARTVLKEGEEVEAKFTGVDRKIAHHLALDQGEGNARRGGGGAELPLIRSGVQWHEPRRSAQGEDRIGRRRRRRGLTPKRETCSSTVRLGRSVMARACGRASMREAFRVRRADMTKSELIEIITAKQKHLPAKDVELALKQILEIMSDALSAGERIEIRGFGSFSLHFRPPRQGRNPKTGEAVALSGKYVPHFKPGKDLRERVNDGAGRPIRD